MSMNFQNKDYYLNNSNYQALFSAYASVYPDFLELEKLGESTGGYSLYVLKITDKKVPQDEKFNIVIACLHAGVEHSGTGAAMSVADFLLSAGGDKYRKKFTVWIMPILNPDGLFDLQSNGNANNIDPYSGNRGEEFSPDDLSLKNPDKSPEIKAFFHLLDIAQPEILCDFHGVSRRNPDVIMKQYIGNAGSNHTLRCWSDSLLNAALQSSAASGVPMLPSEEMLQKLAATNPHQQSHRWLYRDSFDWIYSDHYAYVNYHTLPMVFEIAYENSAVNAFRGILDYGLNPPKIYDGAYPVDSVFVDWAFGMVQAYGRTPGERRRSRCELVRKSETMRSFMLAPSIHGRLLWGVALGRSGCQRLYGADGEKSVSDFFRNKESDEKINWEELAKFAENGNENQFYPIQWWPMPEKDSSPLEHGIVLSWDIQMPLDCNLRIKEVCLNGFPLREDFADGYSLIKHDYGFRLKISISPEKAKNMDVWLISCSYTADKQPEIGWEVPDKIIYELEKFK